MGHRDQDSGSAPTLAGLLLRGRPAARRAAGSEPAPLPQPAPPPEPAPTQRATGGQMSLLFATPPAPPARPRPTSADTEEAASADAVFARSPEVAPALPLPGPERRSSERRIWTVRALVGDVRETVEGAYDDLWVRGEISNCRPALSGHLYFTLRDGDAQLSVVLFRRQAQLLRFAPRDGMEVLVRGRISVFDQRGQLQLIAEMLEPRGAGSLQLAFEQLKARLLAEGLFEAARKRPLPPFPQRIGVITSPSGAVIHDIIRVIRRRHACLDLLLYPAAVQGPECASAVVEGLRWFNRSRSSGEPAEVDLIIIARGGGSFEDLAAFNDEALARAIAASELPVVSAIGHETDFTIADFVADLRAPTPSAAAELITAAQHRIEERVHTLADRLARAIRYQMILRSQRFTRLSTEQMLSRLRDAIGRRGQALDDVRRRLEAASAQRLSTPAARLERLCVRLERAEPARELASARRRVEAAERLLPTRMEACVARARSRLQHASARLAALSPVAVLGRGYALVYAADGTLLRDPAQAAPGETIRARLAQGTLAARVLSSAPDAATDPHT